MRGKGSAWCSPPVHHHQAPAGGAPARPHSSNSPHRHRVAAVEGHAACSATLIAQHHPSLEKSESRSRLVVHCRTDAAPIPVHATALSALTPAQA